MARIVMSGFLHVKTGGTHREMGVDFGRATREILHEFLSESAKFYRRHATHDAVYARRYAMRNFFSHTQRRFPDYLEETRGIAEGAGLTFEDIFFLTADEELATLLWKRKTSEKCSSAVVRTKHGLLLGHNEDYPPHYLGRLVIVDAEPDDAPAFLAVTYPYILTGPGCGFNSAGLAFSADSLMFPPQRVGIPSNFVLRDVYRARRFGEAQKIMATRALMGNAAVIASVKENRAIVVEASLNDTAVITMGKQNFLAHTNHVLADALDRRTETPTVESKNRLAALERAFAGKILDAAQLRRIFSSKKNGLCRIVRGKADSCTVASVVLDPKRKVMYVAKRGPRGHAFQPYRMK